MTKNKLFQDFDTVSSKAYKQKIQVDLKGEDYNDTLIWQSPEGIHVKPFYHRDDVSSLAVITQIPEQWFIGEDVFILEPSAAGKTAALAIENGTEAIHFIADNPFEIDPLFSELTNNDTPLHFQLNFLDIAFAKALQEKATAKKFTIFLNTDIIGNLVKDGNWYASLDQDHKQLEMILAKGGNVLSVDTSHYQNAGATIVQQLAYGLCHVNEYLNYAENKETPLESTNFKVDVGSNYFFEIAKLRALRQLFELVTQEYALAKNAQCHIMARPTRRNKTIYDYNTNMLRTTTECMSAILGGANTIINRPYDDLYHKRNDFGQRISRNQLIILKKESYFDIVSNPSDGAYYIEELTKELSTKALKLFKEIENSGGFLKQLKEGTIQRKIKESAQKEQSAFNTGDTLLLGTNIHPNKKDLMKNELELYPFVKHKPRKTIIEPIIARRLAEVMEQERLKSEV